MSVSLDDAMEFLYGAGEVVHGWSSDRAELVQAAEQRFPGKAFCLVKRWIIVEIPTKEVGPLPGGIAPMIVLAHEVIYDSRGRFVPGSWVRSTYAVSFQHPCMFETRNTIYLLVGDGYRKQASLEFVLSFRP
ncbi:hypothetical protein PPUJ13061_17490 [Pseudomonas putida]|uniref:DUF6957 family protein n=1 Tax=Pseudomonas putida TaxID=303 RepID=UPI000E0DAD65|nr:hypothetical protein [Pseudomonas putida]ELU0815825.1 hypothetical protein [Pseudomonas putida]WQE53019.1 hypothetical protein U0028_24640 [Pseudomonas putida]GLO01851.1 hypothetical protein PPUJ13061_17490 [Pseudomonas putida]HDS1006276.1 hypothetical protein [Pseudomonas putida]